MREEQVILVDEKDQEIGLQGKLDAHKEGNLHRAISVFVFNDQGEWLLQRRALTKYHSSGLWTNSCCSHPRQAESPIDGAHRRLYEEMGITCSLEKAFDFMYKAELDSGLTEHEFDHVFVGRFNGSPEPNLNEVCEWKWMSYEDLKQNVDQFPQSYTAWFKLILERVYRSLPDQLSLVLNVEK